jgi:hypothetical protein
VLSAFNAAWHQHKSTWCRHDVLCGVGQHCKFQASCRAAQFSSRSQAKWHVAKKSAAPPTANTLCCACVQDCGDIVAACTPPEVAVCQRLPSSLQQGAASRRARACSGVVGAVSRLQELLLFYW